MADVLVDTNVFSEHLRGAEESRVGQHRCASGGANDVACYPPTTTRELPTSASRLRPRGVHIDPRYVEIQCGASARLILFATARRRRDDAPHDCHHR